jgi:hypothetical protein
MNTMRLQKPIGWHDMQIKVMKYKKMGMSGKTKEDGERKSKGSGQENSEFWIINQIHGVPKKNQ